MMANFRLESSFADNYFKGTLDPLFPVCVGFPSQQYGKLPESKNYVFNSLGLPT